ncbi:MAG: malate dehydrogenase [Gammaproteobacteria bacterium]|nr:malate dehydrogenase [Gammaproteobacteria bacterium]MDX2486417.1 malate dehydrogenase [Gammaproteobacteria bacterium]
MNKIAIIGAGRVGESTAQFLATRDLCREVVLSDIREGAAEGAALDIQESASLFGFDTRLSGSSNNEIIEDADIIIITAGIPRKPGMTRADVMETNVRVLDQIIDDVLEYAPESMLLLVSNPVDTLTHHALKRTGWDRGRIMGQAGVLDSSRMAAFVALETGLSATDVNAMVMGGHGDVMVPMTRFTTISGIGIEHFLPPEKIEEIIQRTRVGGAEILKLRGNSSAYDAPAAAVAEMVEAIAYDRKSVLPTVTFLEGEYGQNDITIGVPAVLGKNGMERVIELELNEAELGFFNTSVAAIRKELETLSEITSQA